MTTVTWLEKVEATKGVEPVVRYSSGGVCFEDYLLSDGYWRYTWVNFKFDDHPEFVEVYLMEI